jgi:cell division cycle 2-like protein
LVREGFPTSALREISLLLQLRHENIVNVREVVIGSDLNKIFVVMDYMDHTLRDLNEFRARPFSVSEVKCLMLQILSGIKYLHDNWVIHRDLKTSNILMDNKGNLKICDFGMARKYGSPLRPYSPVVVTLWYRAPEVLLGAKTYGPAVDMWSVGCIFVELLTKEVLFPGEGEMDQLRRIFQELGLPNENRWKGYSELPVVQRFRFNGPSQSSLHKRFQKASASNPEPLLSELGMDLLSRLLEYDPEQRITAEEALNHPYFTEHPLPKSKLMMPTFPTDIHETGNRKKRRL